MKKFFSVVPLVVMVLGSGCAAQDDGTRQSVAELKTKIEALEARLKAVEDRPTTAAPAASGPTIVSGHRAVRFRDEAVATLSGSNVAIIWNHAGPEPGKMAYVLLPGEQSSIGTSTSTVGFANGSVTLLTGSGADVGYVLMKQF